MFFMHSIDFYYEVVKCYSLETGVTMRIRIVGFLLSTHCVVSEDIIIDVAITASLYPSLRAVSVAVVGLVTIRARESR